MTTAEAAKLAGMTPASFRREMSRQRAAGNDMRMPGAYPDRPLWEPSAIAAWLEARPGRGNWRAAKPSAPG